MPVFLGYSAKKNYPFRWKNIRYVLWINAVAWSREGGRVEAR